MGGTSQKSDTHTACAMQKAIIPAFAFPVSYLHTPPMIREVVYALVNSIQASDLLPYSTGQRQILQAYNSRFPGAS